jgi:hypothetical protein
MKENMLDLHKENDFKLDELLRKKVKLSDLAGKKTGSSQSTIATNTQRTHVVHLCTHDYGGAGNSAYRLHKGLKKDGISSNMLVLNKLSDDSSVKIIKSDSMGRILEISSQYKGTSQIYNKEKNRWKNILKNYSNKDHQLEFFSDAASSVCLESIPDVQEATVINLHWVAGLIDYLKAPQIFKNKAVVWTLHDMNVFTGGCHYSHDCQRYKAASLKNSS